MLVSEGPESILSRSTKPCSFIVSWNLKATLQARKCLKSKACVRLRSSSCLPSTPPSQFFFSRPPGGGNLVWVCLRGSGWSWVSGVKALGSRGGSGWEGGSPREPSDKGSNAKLEFQSWQPHNLQKSSRCSPQSRN